MLGAASDKALAGQTQFLENQRMFLDRFGYLEETFFTFSFSPILDESGRVGGLFHPVTELTQQTRAERTGKAQTVREASARVLETLGGFDLDLPFMLRATRAGRQAMLAVQDNSLDMSEVQQRQLFGLFQRLHIPVEGTGVGLYITKRLVENSGTIAVQREPNIGTTFTVTFPA